MFDPLAVIMLLAAQMTFGWRKNESVVADTASYEADDGPLTSDQINQIKEEANVTEHFIPNSMLWPFTVATHTEPVPSETPSTALGGDITAPEEPDVPNTSESELEKWNKMIEEAEKAVEEEKKATIEPEVHEAEDSKKKTYMTKDETGKIQVKTRSS